MAAFSTPRGVDFLVNCSARVHPCYTVLPMSFWQVTSGFSPELHRALFELEKDLLSQTSNEIPCLAVGIIYITSDTFRKFVLAETRKDHENDSGSEILIISPDSGNLVLTSSREYKDLKTSLNFHEVFGERGQLANGSLTYEQVLLATLRACLRVVAFQFPSTLEIY